MFEKIEILQADSIEGLIAHYNWLKKYLVKYNKECHEDDRVFISTLSNHYEELTNYKENMLREDFIKWKESGYLNSARIKGDFVVAYRATIEIKSPSEHEYEYFNRYLGDCYDDYPGESGADEVTPLSGEDKERMLIKHWKMEKFLEYKMKVPISEIEEPTTRDLKIYKEKNKKEWEQKRKSITESWKGFEDEIY